MTDVQFNDTGDYQQTYSASPVDQRSSFVQFLISRGIVSTEAQGRSVLIGIAVCATLITVIILTRTLRDSQRTLTPADVGQYTQMTEYAQ